MIEIPIQRKVCWIDTAKTVNPSSAKVCIKLHAKKIPRPVPSAAPKREQRYTVTPKPTSADADDDFGFNETTSFFEDAKNFDPESGTDK